MRPYYLDMTNNITVTGKSNTQASKTVTSRATVFRAHNRRTERLAITQSTLGMLHAWGTTGAARAAELLDRAAGEFLIYG